MKKHTKKGNPSTMRCPHCGAAMILRSADGIYRDNTGHAMLYVCRHYPQCDTYVRTHPGTTTPVGTPANRKLRALRSEAHRHFDQLYRSGLMSKQEAYRWLAALLQAPLSQAHIGYLGEYYCKQVIQASQDLIARAQRRTSEEQSSGEAGETASCN